MLRAAFLMKLRLTLMESIFLGYTWACCSRHFAGTTRTITLIAVIFFMLELRRPGLLNCYNVLKIQFQLKVLKSYVRYGIPGKQARIFEKIVQNHVPVLLEQKPDLLHRVCWPAFPFFLLLFTSLTISIRAIVKLHDISCCSEELPLPRIPLPSSWFMIMLMWWLSWTEEIICAPMYLLMRMCFILLGARTIHSDISCSLSRRF